MSRFRPRAGSVLCALLVHAPALAYAQGPGAAPAAAPFRVEEATIADIHAALRAGTLTCRALVDQYLRRIDAYDKAGPAINAIIVVNPAARATADSLDRRYALGGFVGPLHCVPMIVKDNFDTKDLQTTAGSLSMKGFVPQTDATMVQRLRDAGAIVLAKSNMAEFAFSPYETVSSILPGYTKNPYALDRVTAGSSGGTAAAVASSFGAAGLGTDTGNSIRGPSSHQALVGIRSTMGLTSRAGVVPLNLSADIAGPIARTVADAVAVFQVVAGPDPRDPVTAAAREHPLPDYSASLVRDGLRGARIGVLTQAYDTTSADPEVLAVFRNALAELARAGATVVGPVLVDSLDEMRRAAYGAGGCNPFKHDLDAYLSAHPNAPVHSLADIIKSRRFHPSIERRLEAGEASTDVPDESPGCRSVQQFRVRLRAAVTRLMDARHLDALVYPTWSNVPRLIGDLNTPAGDNSQLFSPTTGFPAVQVPMGFTRGDRLPAGMTFYGRPWSEAELFKLAYSYEQATHHRHAPPTVPPLPPLMDPFSSTQAGVPEDTARGIVAVVGTDRFNHVILKLPGGKGLTLAGPEAAAIASTSGADVWVSGIRLPNGDMRVARFVVRSVDGQPATDGALKRSGGQYYIVTADGARHPIDSVPEALRPHLDQRVWVTGNLERGPVIFGVIAAVVR